MANGKTASLQLDKTNFAPSESINIHFTAPSTLPGDAWVGIIPSNIQHGNETVNDQNDITYQYINKQTSGTMTFTAPSNPGAWDFRMNDTDNNGTEIASISFTVSQTGASSDNPNTNPSTPGDNFTLKATPGNGKISPGPFTRTGASAVHQLTRLLHHFVYGTTDPEHYLPI